MKAGFEISHGLAVKLAGCFSFCNMLIFFGGFPPQVPPHGGGGGLGNARALNTSQTEKAVPPSFIFLERKKARQQKRQTQKEERIDRDGVHLAIFHKRNDERSDK